MFVLIKLTYRKAHRPLHSEPPSHAPQSHTDRQTRTTGH